MRGLLRERWWSPRWAIAGYVRMAIQVRGSAMFADMGEPTDTLFVATIVGSHTLYVTRSLDPPLAINVSSHVEYQTKVIVDV